MKPISKLLASLAVSTVLTALSGGCGDNIRPPGPGADDLEVIATEAAPRVLPGGELLVTVHIMNTGVTTWPAGMMLAYRGDPGWGVASWQLDQPVDPGAAILLVQSMTAPTRVGLHTLAWQAVNPARGEFGPLITVATEVTCSDGVFCNGHERLVAGACMDGLLPCDDGAACTADACDEDLGRCAYTLGEGCPSCDRGACVPDCTGKVCGDDGCGTTCGACDPGYTCVDGACGIVSQPGTCADPLPLIAPGTPLIGTHVITGDTSGGVNEVAPACNTASTARELVYTFTTTELVGIDARMEGYDTVLDLRLAECADTAASVDCSDDSTPPGDTGSRVATMLQPGTYYLIADGYSGNQMGPFTLTVRFTENGCVPQCDGRYCGDDNCGGSCGECGAGEACTPSGRCLPDPCVPACAGKECGEDGCGGTCGTCTDGELCVEADGQCRLFTLCDHAQPDCPGGCGDTEYCGTDCLCHDIKDPSVDLIVGIERLANEISVETRHFIEASCAVFEGCVDGIGDRKLLRFTVASVNQGRGLFKPPPPAERPDLFEYSPCHGHFHFRGFAEYSLLDEQGGTVLVGRKQAYCLTDSEQAVPGPGVACEPVYHCDDQGLQGGWADIYDRNLDCQWLDITDIPAGSYQLRVILNPNRVFDEESFDNNSATVPVTIE